MLNKTSKLLNEERIRIEKEFMKPFEEFKSEVSETCNLIKQASAEIDVIVKDVENKAKEQRKNIISQIFDENVNELKDVLTLEKIFDEKWLNKGSFKEDGSFKLEEELTITDNNIFPLLSTSTSIVLDFLLVLNY